MYRLQAFIWTTGARIIKSGSGEKSLIVCTLFIQCIP